MRQSSFAPLVLFALAVSFALAESAEPLRQTKLTANQLFFVTTEYSEFQVPQLGSSFFLTKNLSENLFITQDDHEDTPSLKESELNDQAGQSTPRCKVGLHWGWINPTTRLGMCVRDYQDNCPNYNYELGLCMSCRAGFHLVRTRFYDNFCMAPGGSLPTWRSTTEGNQPNSGSQGRPVVPAMRPYPTGNSSYSSSGDWSVLGVIIVVFIGLGIVMCCCCRRRRGGGRGGYGGVTTVNTGGGYYGGSNVVVVDEYGPGYGGGGFIDGGYGGGGFIDGGYGGGGFIDGGNDFGGGGQDFGGGGQDFGGGGQDFGGGGQDFGGGMDGYQPTYA
jgi:hypothetical protein